MEIYLIRHSQTALPPGWCYGQTDVALTDDFIDAAQRIRLALPPIAADCPVFSSPLSRCLRLAETLGGVLVPDARLQELDFGAWENQALAALDSPAFRAWSENFVDTAPPGGETFTQLCERVAEFWRELCRLDAEMAVVVAHAGSIRALLAGVLGLPLANAFQFRVDFASIHHLQYRDGYTQIGFLNQQP